ncbi:MAG: ASCH domain-containing protein [Anaerolineae bacterium]|nr:ASCH domain-containing protein [Anaerolineae bacterium]
MIFTPEHCELILSGCKTQTRRVVKGGEILLEVSNCHMVYIKNRIKWEVGKTYALQPGRGKKAVGRIRITDIRKEPLQELSTEDAIAEGVVLKDYVGPRLRYSNLWDSINTRKGIRWNDNPDVWVITFEMAADQV